MRWSSLLLACVGAWAATPPSGAAVPPSTGPADAPSRGDDLWQPCERTTSSHITCPAGYGLLVFDMDSISGDSTASFEVSPEDDVEVKVFLEPAELEDLDGDQCFLTLLQKKVTSPPSSSIAVYISSQDDIKLTNNDDEGNCTASLKYILVTPVYNTVAIDAASSPSYIEFPSENEEDKDLQLGYAPQQRKQWTLTGPENTVWVFIVEYFDLGSRQQNLRSEPTNYNSSQNDFIMIGADEELLVTDEVTLFGRRANSSRQTVRVNSNVAHVALYTSYHDVYAGGFRIAYEAESVVQPSTTPTPSPSPPTPASPLPMIWAEINGAQKTLNDSSGNRTVVEAQFQQSISAMATAYANDTGMPLSSVEPSDVEVTEIKSCVPENDCDPSCAAFYFGILTTIPSKTAMGRLGRAADEDTSSDETEEEEELVWAFSEEALLDMVEREESQEYWALLGEECEYCYAEHINWLIYGGVAAVAVVVGVAVSVAVRKVAHVSSANRESTKLAAVRAEEAQDMKRRSSSILSKIGGPKRKSHTSHPFSDSRGASVDSAIPEMLDASEYSDFEDDFDDFDHYNRGRGPADTLPAAIATTSHTNAAFVGDAPSRPELSHSVYVNQKGNIQTEF